MQTSIRNLLIHTAIFGFWFLIARSLVPIFEDMVPPWILVCGGMASFHAYFFIGDGSMLDNPKNFFETERWKVLTSGTIATLFVTMCAVVLEIYTK